jgi:hypothetical protein
MSQEMSDKGIRKPWFKRFIFPFWIYPVSWKGLALLALSLPSTAVCVFFMSELVEKGGVGFYVAGAAFVLIAATTLVLAHLHTE